MIRNDLLPQVRQLFETSNASFKEINIFGIRNMLDPELDEFNDFIGLITEKELRIYEGTTDPGQYWVKNPITSEGITGAAHLCEGYHHNCWIVGVHMPNTNFAHEGLIQWGAPVHIWRDTDGDNKYSAWEPKTEGWYGINLHSTKTDSATKIYNYSAGCQVIKNYTDHLEFMELIKSSIRYRQNPQCCWGYLLLTKEQVNL